MWLSQSVDLLLKLRRKKKRGSKKASQRPPKLISGLTFIDYVKGSETHDIPSKTN
jgi:hypothetical protein